MATARVPDAPLARREAVRLGVRTVMPLAVGALPFGIVFGVTAASSSLTWWEGLVASALIMAGAAQLALVDPIDTDTPWLLAVVTALIINARFLLYSTALAPAFRRFPVRWRYGLAHLMTDQAAVTGIVYFEHQRDDDTRRWFFAAVGMVFSAAWLAGTAIGLAFSASMPEALPLGFAVPLTFLALLVPAVRSRPMVVAAVVGALATVLAAPLPQGLNILLGGIAGVAAGVVANR
ncbi:MAG: AzlC family ABC transporter permease [Acidimicrobiales bacterium]